MALILKDINYVLTKRRKTEYFDLGLHKFRLVSYSEYIYWGDYKFQSGCVVAISKKLYFCPNVPVHLLTEQCYCFHEVEYDSKSYG